MKKIFNLMLVLLTILCTNVIVFASSDNINDEYLQILEEEKQLYEEKMENIERNYIDSNVAMNARTPYFVTGDVIITNATSSKGLTGHAGIFISPTEILHIQGPGYSPTVISINQWLSKYNTSSSHYSDVYRPGNYVTYGSNAGSWVKNTYRYSNASYQITNDRTSTNPTYCSIIPWQGYKYGIGSSAVSSSSEWGVITPYGLTDSITNNKYIGSLN